MGVAQRVLGTALLAQERPSGRLVVADFMVFLNPIFLLGLMAAALPLIIHLFNFRKPRKVDFSSLAFLREVEKSTMRRVRIKQWLLLALRTLAIAAIVLSFARPIFRGEVVSVFAGAAPVSIAVIVDNSPSMSQRDSRGAYFDQAVRLAMDIVQDTDTRDEVAVVPLQSDSPILFSPGGQSAKDRIEALEVRDGIRTQFEAIREASVAMSAAENQNREIYLVGDFQASTLMNVPSSTLANTPSSTILAGATVRLVQVGSAAPQNIAVQDVEILSRIVEVDHPVRLAATLTNYGEVSAAGYVTSVFLEGERVAQRSSDLPAGESVAIEFSITPSRKGWLQGVVETEDDSFPADNRAYFTLRVPEERSVLLLEGVDQDTRFINAALSADTDRVSLIVSRAPESELPALDLADFDVVILAGPATLSSGEVDRISDYVEAGGGIMWFPSTHGSQADDNALLLALGGGTVGGLAVSSGLAIIDVVERVDLEHPLFDGVLDSSSGGLERPDIFRRMSYTPGRGTEASVITLSSGGPLVQEIRHGAGSVLWFAVGLDPTWSDLPTRGLFVPLLYRSIFLLSSTETLSGEAFRTGTGGEVLLPGLAQNARVVMEDPDGQETVPPVRPGIGGIQLNLEGLLRTSGIYDLSVDNRLVRRIAVNPSPLESNLSLEGAASSASILSEYSEAPVSQLEVGRENTVSAQIAESRRGAELWNVFLLIALFCLAAEMIVAKRWKPESST